jgi:large subunit ribosomal protein L22
MNKQVLAHQKFIRITPRKLRLLADMVRPLGVEPAIIQLKVSSKRGAKTILKVLTQAKTNAINSGLRSETLKIKSIEILEGPTFKRWNPVSRGRAHSIMKRTSHIKIILEGSDQPSTKPASKKTESVKKGK